MTAMSVQGRPVSYSTARGNFTMIHIVVLFWDGRGWRAFSQGLCGAALLVKAGRLQVAGPDVALASCHRCQRELAAAGVSTEPRTVGGRVIPGWREVPGSVTSALAG
jgi:hypothetical protein